MKRYSELTEEQKTKAVGACVEKLLADILEGRIRFNDALNSDDLQSRIDKACQKAEAMQTPWFAGSYIMDTCKDDIEGMASCSAEDALYSENEQVIAGIC